jgi:hypothetical protein
MMRSLARSSAWVSTASAARDSRLTASSSREDARAKGASFAAHMISLA